MTEQLNTGGTARRKWPDDYMSDDPEKHGVRCPKCNCPRTKVSYIRHTVGGRNHRRRECCHCGAVFSTWERV